MGAIFAILGDAGDPELVERLERMLARSPYRGEPEFLVEGPLAVGIQSMGWDASLADDGDWLVAFHGYIGNWAVLAAERGWRFRDGASNAEKIAVAFEDLGERLLAKLRGEWAVLIWDRRDQTLLASRDVIGCRPLFRQSFNGRTFVATEVRQVLAGSGAPLEIDIETFRRFLHVEPNRDRSSVRCVRQVPAGGSWGCNADHDTLRPRPFFRFGSSWPELSRVSLDEAAEVVRDRLVTAVARASADYPIGVALSGGLDSSTVWEIVNNIGPLEIRQHDIVALCLRFPDRNCDEGAFMESVLAYRPGPRVDIRLYTAMVLPCLDEAAAKVDTPFLASVISQLELARAAGANARSIILTGHGGDYAFQGDLRDLERAVLHEREPSAAWWAARLAVGQRILHVACRRLISRLTWRPPATMSPSKRGEEPAVTGILSDEARALWGGGDDALDEAGRRSMLEGLAIEQAGWSLTPWEQVTASFGVEIRHPFFDLDLLEAALSVPQKLHLARGFRKGLLRAAIGLNLPWKVRSRRGKTTLSEFVIEGLSGVRREPLRDGRPSGESPRMMRELPKFDAVFGEEFVYPLRLLIADLIRRGQRQDEPGSAK